jgi:hypothetical protein
VGIVSMYVMILVSTWIKSSFNCVYKFLDTVPNCKSVFNSEFYPKFISFGIRASYYVKYGIGPNSLNMGSNGRCGFVVES